MRISSAAQYDAHLLNLQRQNSRLNTISQQYNTGLRFQQAAESPSDMSARIKLEGDISTFSQYAVNAGFAKEALGEEETALAAMWDILASAQTRIQQAVNGSQDQNSLDAIAEDLEHAQAQLFDLMNTRNCEGEYIFSGADSATPTYVKDVSGTYVCQADGSTRSMQITPTLTVQTSDSGLDVFEHVPVAHKISVTATAKTYSNTSSVDGVLKPTVTNVEAFENFIAEQTNPTISTDQEGILAIVFDQAASTYKLVSHDYPPKDLTSNGQAVTGTFDKSSGNFAIYDYYGNEMMTVDFPTSPYTTLDGRRCLLHTAYGTLDNPPNYISNYGDFDDLYADLYDPSKKGTDQQLTLAYTASSTDGEPGTFTLKDSSDTTLYEGEATEDGMIEVKGMHFALERLDANETFTITIEEPEKDNILNQLQIVIDKLRSADELSSDEFYQYMQEGQRAVSFAKDHYDLYRGRTGARQEKVERLISSDEMLSDIKTEARANTCEADAFEVASKMVQNQSSLQAAQQAYQMVHSATLFDYI